MAARIRGFGAFLYDFFVGDDWWVAVGVVAGLAITYGITHTTAIAAWWLLPALLGLLLPLSLWRAIRKS